MWCVFVCQCTHICVRHGFVVFVLVYAFVFVLVL
jgi:hypothetical protein